MIQQKEKNGRKFDTKTVSLQQQQHEYDRGKHVTWDVMGTTETWLYTCSSDYVSVMNSFQ